MEKICNISEVEILRFFENGSIEKAEVVFNIVQEKMRERLSPGRSENPPAPVRRSRKGSILPATDEGDPKTSSE